MTPAELERVADLFAAHPFRSDEVLVARDFGHALVAAIVVPTKRARALARTARAKRIARRLSERAPVGHVYLLSFGLNGGVSLDLMQLEPRTNARGGVA